MSDVCMKIMNEDIRRSVKINLICMIFVKGTIFL